VAYPELLDDALAVLDQVVVYYTLVKQRPDLRKRLALHTGFLSPLCATFTCIYFAFVHVPPAQLPPGYYPSWDRTTSYYAVA